MQLNFVTVDVFTDQQFGGNPLAVVLNGYGLTTEQMQSIAAEFTVGARLAAPQPLMRSEDVALDVVATACSIGASDIETANHPPCICSSGVPFVLAELKTRSALRDARAQSEIFSKHLKADRATGILLYTHGKGDDVDIQARMFAPLYGVPEDPATGSANVTLAGLLASLRGERDLTLQLRIAQA
jgi:trans-2,3-dihydro-3-hydroxyanthranilate isomerase